MLKVLIVENDLLMADMLEEALDDAGYDVCGIARTVEEAVALGEREDPDLALLDLRLAAGGLGTEIAARLDRESGLGILYVTGNAEQIYLTKADGDACLVKPYRSEDIVRGLKIVSEVIANGLSLLPFPGGFRLLEEVPSTSVKGSADGKNSRDFTIGRLLRQQAALAEFGSLALVEKDLGTMLTEAARVCAECLGVPFSKVCRYRPEENDLLVEAGVGWNPGVIGHVVSRADNSSPQGRAFVTGLPVICADLSKDDAFVLPAFYSDHGIISTLDVIIRNKDGQPWGVLEIDNPRRHVYDEHDVDFVTGFANVLAEAVDASKRNRALQAALDQMQGMVADRDRLVASQTRLLSDKDMLAQELQHRVRNNLQLVYGMLNKHLGAPGDSVAGSEVAAIARRVMILAKVYDHLLGTGLGRTIDFGSYLTSLCDSFKDLEPTERRDIGLTCHGMPFMLDLDTATALGLAVSELISNSYQHAFPAGTGTIKVSLLRDASGSGAEIEFADNGVGFVEGTYNKRRGIGLVRRLIEQVDGSATVQSDKGTVWTLKFPMPALPPKNRAAGTSAASRRALQDI
jgi:two-component sensor histidine kinase